MYCPECRSEYQSGVSRCEECGVELVDALPADDHSGPDMVQVLRTNNQSLLVTFRTTLEAAGIAHTVRGAEAASLMPLNATVFVPADRAEEARELLQAAQDEGDIETSPWEA